MKGINNALNIMELQEEIIQPDIVNNEENGSLLAEDSDKEDKDCSPIPSSLTSYLKDISRVPLLTREEESYWAKRLYDLRKQENRLLKRMFQILGSLQQDRVHTNFKLLAKRFFLGDRLQKNALAFSKRNCKKADQLTNSSSSLKGKNKSKKEMMQPKAADSESLHTINTQAGCQTVSQWQAISTRNGEHGQKPLKELQQICQALKALEPDVQQARKKLIKGNLRLVVSIGKHFKNRGMSFRDLIQEGNLGLIKAIEKFDYRKGFRLSTYSSWWIRESIARALEEKTRNIRIPTHVHEKYYKIKKAMGQIFREQGKDPSIYALARKVSMGPQEVLNILTAFKEPISLESPPKEGVDAVLNYQSDKQPTPFEALCKKTIKKNVVKMIESLSPKEASILKLRFGIGAEDAKSLEEVGKRFNVSRERIRQLENDALKKLKLLKEIEML